MTIIEQQPIIKRTQNFIDRYDMKVKYLASKTNIPQNNLSKFISGKAVLYAPQYERLMAFMDEWDRRMVGFAALEN